MMLCKAEPWARFVMVSASTGRRAWRLSVALDKTVDVVATAAAALFAVDVEHIELADNVAEWIAAFRLASPHGAAVQFVYCSPKPASRRFGNGRGLECGKLLDLDRSGALNVVAGNPTTQMPHRLGAGFL